MATYSEQKDDMVICPLNPSHKVLMSRLSIHMSKCRLSSPYKKPCPYSASHFVPAAELRQHLYMCPERPQPMLTTKRGDVHVSEASVVTRHEHPTVPREYPRVTTGTTNDQDSSKHSGLHVFPATNSGMTVPREDQREDINAPGRKALHGPFITLVSRTINIGLDIDQERFRREATDAPVQSSHVAFPSRLCQRTTTSRPPQPLHNGITPGGDDVPGPSAHAHTHLAHRMARLGRGRRIQYLGPN